MGFCERFVLEIPNDGGAPPAAIVAVGPEIDVGQLGGKGYDFTRDPGAGFTALLEGSVCGHQWATIVALAASAQGTIPDHYTWVRINVTIGGALGATTLAMAAGRTQGP
jgi:hypothetical protein